MQGFRFSAFSGKENSIFDKLLRIFKELLIHTSGDVDEALEWLREIDEEHQITNESYSIEDFIEDLKARSYISTTVKGNGDKENSMTAKTERALRQMSLEQLFGKLKRSAPGNHDSPRSGSGDEPSASIRNFEYGDKMEQLAVNESLKNAYLRQGIEDFSLSEEDLVVRDTEYKAQMSTVLMIDISHSMILYGEDRITPAKKVAMALAEFIQRRYPKDSLDIIVFGDDAWTISLKELPYLQVGPYHTNTVAGLQLAMDILRKKKNANRQIFMITDGKPSCLRQGDGTYYKNSFGLDDFIVNKCLNMAAACRRLKIPITTFMIARDHYLQQFVQDFTEANKGKAFFTGVNGLGDFILADYEKNRRRKI